MPVSLRVEIVKVRKRAKTANVFLAEFLETLSSNQHR